MIDSEMDKQMNRHKGQRNKRKKGKNKDKWICGQINDGQMNTSWVRYPLHASEEMKIILDILFNCCHLVDKIEINWIISLKILSILTKHISPLYYPIEKGSLGQTYQDIIELLF